MDHLCRVSRTLTTRLATLLLFVLSFATSPAHAQVAGTGNIQGIITDPAGAVIPNAKVTITEESTQVVRSVQSDAAGVYIFPNIVVGTYTVGVSSPGFQRYSSTHNVLEVGSNIAVNVQMTIGEMTQTVEVRSESLALQTEDVKFKQTVDQAEISELPVLDRNVTNLLQIAGGITVAPAGDFTGSKYSYATISVSVAGGSGNTTLWRLDGGDNNDYMANGNLPFPFPDALSQFSVESSVLGAQDGMHSGGLVNAVTRSGTNKFHGTAFEYIRNNIINASNFYSTTPDSLHQHQYGGTIGGPILHDKLFAFAGYQRTQKHLKSNSTTAYVPTPAMLAGDFSACESSSKIQLLDPLTGVALPGNKYATAPAYNAQALALVKYMPTQLIGSDPCGQVTYTIPGNSNDNQFTTRVDWTISPKHHFYGRYFIDGYQLPSYFSPNNIYVTTQSGNLQRVQSFTAGEDWTISSHIVNSAHVTVMRRRNNRGYAPNDINASTLGMNIYQAEPNGLQIAAGSRFTIGGGTNSVAHFNDNTLAIDDDVTWVQGKHTIVFGGEFVRNQLNIFNAYESNGTFTFSGVYSGSGPTGTNPTTHTAIVGDPLLDFLQGTLSAFEQSKFQQNALRAPIPSLYVQDTWHANKQLTVIAGIRWSPNYFPYDYFNRGTTFDYNAFLANKVSSIYPGAPAGTFYYGDPGVPRAFTKSTPWQFSPNAGFSYDVTGTGKTVVRGGFELIYDQVNFFTGQRTQQNPSFASAIANAQTSTSGPITFSAPWSTGTTSTNPFPQTQIPTPANAVYFAQSQYIVLPPQFKPSYTEQYTLSVQHQFPHDWQAQLDYIGNHTVHSPASTPLSPAVFVPGVWGAGGTGCPGVVTTGPAGKPAGAAGTPCSTTANQAQRYSLTMANPLQGNQYKGGGAGSNLVNYVGMGNYSGLIATLQHRLSSTFSVLTNYTWSKCLNIEDAQGDYASTVLENPNNPAQDYGPCGSDFRNIFNFVVVARSQFHHSNALVRNTLSGWEMSPLLHITSGAPINVTTGSDVSLTNNGNDRPNRVPGVPLYLNNAIRATGAARGYLNPAAFCGTTCVAPGAYGNLSRNALRGKSFYQFDAQVSRLFPIHQEMNLQLRLECFNVINHPYFQTPSSANAALSAGANFGLMTFTGPISGSVAGNPRLFQGSVKFNF